MAARPVSPEQLAAQRRQWLALLAGTAVVAGVALAFAWAFPIAIAWVQTGQVPRLSIPDAIRAVGTGKALSGDPAAAYPPRVRALVPGGWGYWTTAALLVVLPTALVMGAARAAWVRMSRPTADRRWWQLRGRRPHEFGRYATVRSLAVPGPAAGRHVIGRAPLHADRDRARTADRGDRRARLGHDHGLVEPLLLEHAGPAVSTSTKTDVVRRTLARRERLGEVWVWDPFGPGQRLLGPAA